MERIERLEALSPLVAAQLKKGVATNCYFTSDDYRREIGSGLYLQPQDGGLLLLRRRSGHWILNFYLQPGAELALPPLDGPVVTEVVWRQRDEALAAAVRQRLGRAGFQEQFCRCRRARPTGEPPEGGQAFFPDAGQAEAVGGFLQAQFDPLTGCLPTPAALRDALEAREIAATADARGLTGVLHFSSGRAAWEIRHLAVREDCRGCGLAAALLDACLRQTGGKKSLVWARQGNIPAERFYEKHGYRPDGWQSAVLTAGGKETP